MVYDHGTDDDIGKSTFENPKGFHASVTVLSTSVEQFAGGCVTPCLSQSDPMNAGIDLPVYFARETMSSMIRRPHR